MRQYAACLRCGIKRAVKPERKGGDLCLDCQVVNRDLERLADTAKAACSLGLASEWGYKKHLRAGEDCLVCRQAAARAQCIRSRKRFGWKPRKPAKCGTDSGYHRHRKQKPPEVPCDPCLEAHRLANPYRRKTSEGQAA